MYSNFIFIVPLLLNTENKCTTIVYSVELFSLLHKLPCFDENPIIWIVRLSEGGPVPINPDNQISTVF